MSDRPTPLPRASPAAKAEVSDEVTGEHEIPFASHDYVKAKTKATKKAVDKDSRLKSLQAFFASVVAAIGIAFGVFFKLEARAQEAADAGVKALREAEVRPLERRVTATESDIKELKGDVKQQALEQVRTNVMLENISRRLGTEVPPPAPKVATDGGR